MATAMLQTLLISLLMMTVLSQSQDLQLSMDRRLAGTDDVYGTVLCKAQGTTIKTAKFVRALSGAKTTQRFLLTTSTPKNDVLIDNLRINGTLKQNLATIQADVLERSQFDSNYFTCEVTYVKQPGQREYAFAMVGPGQAPNLQPLVQPDSHSPAKNVTQRNSDPGKVSDVSLSELSFLGEKINRVEGKFQTLSERLDGEMSRNTDEVKQRANNLENSVLQRVASVETDISTRVSRLEDRLASILLSKGGVGSLSVLEEKAGNVTTQTSGGWKGDLRRTKGDVDFNRDWTTYREGFGSPTGDFWLGNEILHNLTDFKHRYELRIVMRLTNGEEKYARYSNFRVQSESQKYRLAIGSYTGTAGNGMDQNDRMYFSTVDRDNDGHWAVHCSKHYQGAWWYSQCGNARLNTQWENKKTKFITWYDGHKWWHVSYTEMKIRRL